MKIDFSHKWALMGCQIHPSEQISFLLDAAECYWLFSEFSSILHEKSEVLRVLNPPRCFKYKHFGGFRKLRQNREFYQQSIAKWLPKWVRNRYLGAQWGAFSDFGRFFEGSDFFINCCRGAIPPHPIDSWPLKARRLKARSWQKLAILAN